MVSGHAFYQAKIELAGVIALLTTTQRLRNHETEVHIIPILHDAVY